MLLLQLRGAAESRNLGSWGVSRCENGLGGGGIGALRGGMREEDVDLSELPTFSIVNPDENEPMKFADKPGELVPFPWEKEMEDKTEEKETRAARLDRLRRRREERMPS